MAKNSPDNQKGSEEEELDKGPDWFTRLLIKSMESKLRILVLPTLLCTGIAVGGVLGHLSAKNMDREGRRIAEVATSEENIQNAVNLAVARAAAAQLNFELPEGIDGETAISLTAEVLAIQAVTKALANIDIEKDQQTLPDQNPTGK